jgi:hypothetical protein
MDAARMLLIGELRVLQTGCQHSGGWHSTVSRPAIPTGRERADGRPDDPAPRRAKCPRLGTRWAAPRSAGRTDERNGRGRQSHRAQSPSCHGSPLASASPWVQRITETSCSSRARIPTHSGARSISCAPTSDLTEKGAASADHWTRVRNAGSVELAGRCANLWGAVKQGSCNANLDRTSPCTSSRGRGSRTSPAPLARSAMERGSGLLRSPRPSPGALSPPALLSRLTKGSTLAGDRRGAAAGQIAAAQLEPEPDIVSDLSLSPWGGQDSNLRPTDYESAALTD